MGFKQNTMGFEQNTMGHKTIPTPLGFCKVCDYIFFTCEKHIKKYCPACTESAGRKQLILF